MNHLRQFIKGLGILPNLFWAERPKGLQPRISENAFHFFQKKGGEDQGVLGRAGELRDKGTG